MGIELTQFLVRQGRTFAAGTGNPSFTRGFTHEDYDKIHTGCRIDPFFVSSSSHQPPLNLPRDHSSLF
jgi:hypothetical protein